jgi:hypothetical protein
MSMIVLFRKAFMSYKSNIIQGGKPVKIIDLNDSFFSLHGLVVGLKNSYFQHFRIFSISRIFFHRITFYSRHVRNNCEFIFSDIYFPDE